MRSSPLANPTPRLSLPLRPVLFGVVAVGLAMAGLALLAETMASDDGTVYLANIDAGRGLGPTHPSIAVVGSGVASGPAYRALLHLLIVRNGPYGADAPPTPAAGATPPPTGQDHGAIAPVVAAILATGVAEADVVVIASPSLISVCDTYAQCTTVRIDVSVVEPTLARLNTIVNAAGATAAQYGMAVQDVGASYQVADCTVLTRAARERAVADAQRRAVDQAAALGVRLGALILASEPAPAASRDASGCAVPAQNFGDSWWTTGSVGLTVPSFDPAVPPDATVTVEVTLAYAIAGDAAPTQPS
jgi:uncharacterized protein YggE